MHDALDIISQLKDFFYELKNNGVNYIVPKTELICPAVNTPYEDVQSSSEREIHVTNSSSLQDNRILIDEFSEEIQNCPRCFQLVKNRTQVVFGAGNPYAELMFVGEAPGSEEDIQGFPFVGSAGQLLTKIIKSIGFEREQVYIANVLKCRPPGNRNPLPDEIENCKEFLFRQIDIIRPKVICALGTFAAQTLLNTGKNISALRGQELKFKDSIVIPTFHPSFLLRSPHMKKEVWKDMLFVKSVLSKSG